jgi:purine-binding chemotaxis protein CheW
MPTSINTDIAANETMLQLLVFKLANEEYALPLTEVREIMKTPEITPVPNMPDTVKGVANLRGKVVTIVDLGTVFNMHTDTPNEVTPEVNPETTSKEATDETETPVAAKVPKTENSQHIVIAEKGDELFGLLVDTASEVLRVSHDSLKPTPDMLQASAHADFIHGVVVIESSTEQSKKRLIVHLDLPRILQNFTSAKEVSTS